MKRERQDGFTAIELLIAVAILASSLLAYVASMIAQRQLSGDLTKRSEALEVVSQFMERLHAEEDWSGLYGRLRLYQIQAQQNAVPGGSSDLYLADGRATWPPTAYFSDFTTDLDVRVVVDVPYALDTVGTAEILREDVVDPSYQLPADLNGDGVVDAEGRDDDYRFLPVKATFLWTSPQSDRRELTMATWLRGTR